MAKPVITDGLMQPWEDDFAAVAELPGVYCKLSGIFIIFKAFNYFSSNFSSTRSN